MTESVQQGMVRGILHRTPDSSAAIVLAHGAGSNCNAKIMVALAETFAAAGIDALRIDLPFRQARPGGPPHPSTSGRDREALAEAVRLFNGYQRVYLGGHSYGGRQASMVAAEQPGLAAALLLLSYPLHPPGKASQMRTAHFPSLRTRCLFVHGTRDPFGTPDEMREALGLIPGPNELYLIEKAGHELKPVTTDPGEIVQRFGISAT